jgi:hypothetical protein
VLERIVDTTRIFEAWSDEEWVNDGAAVRVSLFGFGPIFPVDRASRLDGSEVAAIHADLTAGEGINLHFHARKCVVCFEGIKKPASTFRAKPRALASTTEPKRPPNADVLHPWSNGLIFRKANTWDIDFGPECPRRCSLYERHFITRLRTSNQLATKITVSPIGKLVAP